MTNNRELQARREAAVARGVSTMLPVFAARARGAELWDVEGKRYIDFAGGIGVLNTGHNHPRVIKAVAQQLEGFSHSCFQVAPYESYVALAERLNGLMPGPGPKQTLFLTTGAEAVENAVKIARAHTGRPAVIAFSGAFHGRTMLGMALTGKVVPYKVGFGPFPAEVYHAPFPNPYRGIGTAESLVALEGLFKSDVDPARVAALIVEPVQGEGGFNIAPADWLRGLRAICDAHGILMIVDEIQTGFARTGRMFAIEHAGVAPDLMTTAKSIAGGYPLSAVTGRKEVMESAQPGGLGGTYAGSPFACAAGLAVLDVIAEERLNDRAVVIGRSIIARLEQMARRNIFACIGDIRGLGAMVAMELVKDRDTREPDPALTKAVVQSAGAKGLIVLPCGTYANVIRILVPLVVTDAVLDEGLGILESAMEEETHPARSR
jgi:4-aminobutyrate aminotransferase/(S)-3-amino-2-methylpropionate transaminase